MGGLVGFLFIYILGGCTFIPLLLLVVLLHAHLTFPTHDDTAYQEPKADPIVQPGDDVDAIRRAQKTLGEGRTAENNVFSGYWAVSREYTPNGANGKPPERSTPVGSTAVSAPSPSVYQSMYRSIFDRKPSNSPLDSKGAGKPQRRGSNIFYVVLRHGHLMLFDDDEQLEVRHVISLEHHEVSLYGGGEEIPEGELFIKRNAICLSRRTDLGEIAPDGRTSKPFFLFSENCSEKEDFYFTLLRNQERDPLRTYNPPIPLQYDIKDIIKLVQNLHSSEEHLQTRWINALIGRVFLAVYKTPDVENFLRTKITKKISRVKVPSFLSRVCVRNIDMGEAAPVITNPRLKDLTVDGELVVEADVRYSGNFRIEVAATARIDLGTRFKAREVELLLAVVVKRVDGHAMIRIKPPPSNRIWLTFQTMPKIDMSIEPIVSTRQITYTLILRQIENRIKEVVAESLVYPNWDDFPFSRTEGKPWRGAIWVDETPPDRSQDLETAAVQDGVVEEPAHLETESEEATISLPQMEKSMSTPLVDASSNTAYARKGAKSTLNLVNSKVSGTSTGIETRSSAPEKPRALRSGSFAAASTPIVSTDVINADALLSSTPPEHSHAMAAISALSHSNSPLQTPVGSPSRPSRMDKAGSLSSTSSRESQQSEQDSQNDLTPQPSVAISDNTTHIDSTSFPPSPASIGNLSLRSDSASTKSFGSFGRDPRRENSSSSSVKSSPTETKRLSLAAVSNAAATAKKWGWNAIRQGDQKETPSRPLVMGRGQPLPPPGVPLPLPDKRTKTAPIPVPKRKPVPPAELVQKAKDSVDDSNPLTTQHHALPPPPLPKRRNQEGIQRKVQAGDDGVFVIAAPAGDSEPTTPMSEHAPAYMPPWVEDAEDIEEESQVSASDATDPAAPPLPRRRPPHRTMSSSPEEDGDNLPSWMAAQEEEARSKSTFVDEDSGV